MHSVLSPLLTLNRATFKDVACLLYKEIYCFTNRGGLFVTGEYTSLPTFMMNAGATVVSGIGRSGSECNVALIGISLSFQDRIRFYTSCVRSFRLPMIMESFEQARLGDLLLTYPCCTTFILSIGKPSLGDALGKGPTQIIFHRKPESMAVSHIEVKLRRALPEGLFGIRDHGRKVAITAFEGGDYTEDDGGGLLAVQQFLHPMQPEKIALDFSKMRSLQLKGGEYDSSSLLTIIRGMPDLRRLACRIKGFKKLSQLEEIVGETPLLTSLEMKPHDPTAWEISFQDALKVIHKSCPLMESLSIPLHLRAQDHRVDPFNDLTFPLQSPCYPRYHSLQLWLISAGITYTAAELNNSVIRFFSPACHIVISGGMNPAIVAWETLFFREFDLGRRMILSMEWSHRVMMKGSRTGGAGWKVLRQETESEAGMKAHDAIKIDESE